MMHKNLNIQTRKSRKNEFSTSEDKMGYLEHLSVLNLTEQKLLEYLRRSNMKEYF